MRVIALNCGGGTLPGCRLVGVMPQRVTCRCLLIDSADGLILIDAGLGRLDARSPRRRLGLIGSSMGFRISEAETAHAQIERLGFEPGDVRHIVLTHLDFDHAGGLADFPHATVHVVDAERRSAARRRSLGAWVRYRPVQWSHGVRWAASPPMAPASWFGLASAPVDAGGGVELRLVHLPGHTRDHCGVAVRFDGSWLLHAGDSYLSRWELGDERRPLVLRAFLASVHAMPRTAARTLRRLRELRSARGRDVQVCCAHDPRERLDGVEAGPPADARPVDRTARRWADSG